MFYLVVFNGNSSELYVDGGREGTATSDVGTGWLDGLTIGTDHREDFPLGSTEEGTLSFTFFFGSTKKHRHSSDRNIILRHIADLVSYR